MSVGLKMKLDPKKVSALVQDVYIFLGKNRLSQEEFAYKVNLHVTTVKNLLNRNYCTKRTALMVCPVIEKQYSSYGFEEEGTVSEDFKKKKKQTEKPKKEPVDITAIYQEVSKVMYGIMKDTFEEFLKNNADKYIQKKKGFFK